MIDENKIKEAARQWVNAFRKANPDGYSTIIVDIESDCMDNFKAGAAWALQEFKKSLWHDASEEPKSDRENETCFGIRRSGFDIKFSREDLKFPINGKIYSWKEYTEELHLLKWAYLEDLMQIGREGLSKGGEQC